MWKQKDLDYLLSQVQFTPSVPKKRAAFDFLISKPLLSKYKFDFGFCYLKPNFIKKFVNISCDVIKILSKMLDPRSFVTVLVHVKF